MTTTRQKPRFRLKYVLGLANIGDSFSDSLTLYRSRRQFYVVLIPLNFDALMVAKKPDFRQEVLQPPMTSERGVTSRITGYSADRAKIDNSAS